MRKSGNRTAAFSPALYRNSGFSAGAEGLQTIDQNAFYSCTALKYVVIPAGTGVDPKAFGNCPDIVMERK